MTATMYEFNGDILPYTTSPSGTFTNQRTGHTGESVTILAAVTSKMIGQNVSVIIMNLSGHTSEFTTRHGDDEWVSGAYELRSLSATWQTAIFTTDTLSDVNGVTEGWDESDVRSGRYHARRLLTPDKVYTPVKAGYEFSPATTTLVTAEGTGLFATFEPSDLSYKVTDPGPEDDAIDVNRITNLTWDEGADAADDYNVWFGTPGNMVLVGTEVTDEFFDIADYTGGLALDTEYEWRIDSYVGGIRLATGDVWSYTTRAQRTVILSSPTDEDTGLLLPPFLIEWTIDGIGAQYGSEEDQDFLFIYMKKDDANFTEDNLIGNFVQAFVNDDLRIVALTEPVYGSAYYWQVQAGNTAADLADSEVWSFTMLELLPPAPSLHPVSGNLTGENTMLTIKRLIAAANNKIWYEEDNEE